MTGRRWTANWPGSRRHLAIALGLVLLLIAGSAVLAGVPADLSWHIVAGGGGQSASASYVLGATLGQPVAGSAGSPGRQLCAGFWCGAVLQPTAPRPTRTATSTGQPPSATPTATPTATRTGQPPPATPTPTATRTLTRTVTPTPTATSEPGPPTTVGSWECWTNGNYVRGLALDDGVLWAGTEGGAVRWDIGASSYTKYAAPDGLGDGYVWAVDVDADRTLWLATQGGGLVARRDGAWLAFTGSDGLASMWVYSLASEAALKWVGTSYGLNAFDPAGTAADRSDDTWTTFRTTDGLPNNNIRSVVLDSAHRKWLGTRGGLSVLNDAGTPHDKSDDVWGTFDEADGLVDRRIEAVVVDQADRVWLGTTGGVSVLDHAGTPFDKADDTWTTFLSEDGLTDDDAYGLALDSHGRLWIATYGGGLFVLDHNGTPFDKADDTWVRFSTSDGLVSNVLYTLQLNETAGEVWLGTWGDGVARLNYAGTITDKSDDTWTTFATDDPLPDNYVPAVLPEGDHAWLATYDGLTVTDGTTWTIFGYADGLARTGVRAIAAHGDLMWIGTSYGLNVLDHGGSPHDKSDDAWLWFNTDDGLNTASIWDIDFDAAGRLWAGSYADRTGETYTGGGLSVLDDGGTPLDKSDDVWETYTPEDSGGAMNGLLYEIAVDGPQRVWVTVYPWWTGSEYIGEGVAVLDHAGTPFDKSDDSWASFTTDDGVLNRWVQAVAADSAGRIWIGSNSGLNVLDYAGTPFDKSDDVWTSFTAADGLVGSVINGITFAADGRVWLATNGGLMVLDHGGTPDDKSDDRWWSWQVTDGLVDNDVLDSQPAASGRVWAGTNTGVCRSRPGAERLYLPLLLRNHP
jgi:ligand-binding sensor domain-containing protein